MCLRRSRRTRLFVWAGSPALHGCQRALPCKGNATQAITQNHALESRPPARLKKNTKSLSHAGKVHKCTLPAFTCCIKHLGKPFLAQIQPFFFFRGITTTQKENPFTRINVRAAAAEKQIKHKILSWIKLKGDELCFSAAP